MGSHSGRSRRPGTATLPEGGEVASSPGASRKTSTTRQRRWLSILTIVALVAVSYFRVAQLGYIWDDDAYVTGNFALRSLEGLYRIWFVPSASPQYYPLVFTTFWLEYHLWGLSPLGYHVVNVLLHAGTAIGVWLLLELLAVPGAWVAAAAFAVHPLNVESVAWVTERKNVLAGLFCVLSSLLFLRSKGVGSPNSMPEGEAPAFGSCYWKAFALFGAALLSKSVVAMQPVALAVVLWWKRGALSRKDAVQLAPFLAVGAGSGLFTAWLERVHVGAQGAEWSLTAAERLLVAGRTALFYVGKVLWPRGLLFSYPRWEVSAAAPWQYLFPVGVVVAVAILWAYRGRLGRGPLAAALCYLALLFPASGVLNVYPMRFSFVADHFVYLASIPVFAGLAAAGRRVVARGRRAREGRSRPWIEPALAGIVLASLAGLTAARVPIFRNEETLWTATLAENPRSWMSANNLGLLRYRQGRLAEAMPLLRRAESLKPDEASVKNNIGLVLMASGSTDEAIRYYQEAIRLERRAVYLNNIGIALAMKGQIEEAIRYYREALTIDANYPEAYYNLGFELEGVGRKQEAAVNYQLAIEKNPDYADAHNNLGRIYGEMGQYDDAIQHFREAVRLRPDLRIARENLEAALTLQRRELQR